MSTSIFELLPASRRRELELEAMTALIRNTFFKHRNMTFGALMSAFANDKHWNAIKNVRISSVLTPANGTTSALTRRRGRPPKDLNGATDKLLGAIKKHPGLRSEQLQKYVEIPQSTVKAALGRLRLMGKVKTRGKRRSTTYKVV